MATFPFGWIRGYGEDNWQILWNSETGEISLRGARTKRVIGGVERAPDWFTAKLRAEELVENPAKVAKRIDASCG